jgi:hypothetical protein
VWGSESVHDSSPWIFSITIEDDRTLFLHKKGVAEKSEPYKNIYSYKDWERGELTYGNESNDYIEIVLGKMTSGKISFSRYYTNGDLDIGSCQPENAIDYYEYGDMYVSSTLHTNHLNGLSALKKSCHMGYNKACDEINSYKNAKLILWLMYFSIASTGLYLINRLYKTHKIKNKEGVKVIVFEVLGMLIAIGFFVAWYNNVMWGYYAADTAYMLLFTLSMLFLPLWHYIARAISIKLYKYLIMATKKGLVVAKRFMRDTMPLGKRCSVADELLKWVELREKGSITEEEFQEQKKELLSSVDMVYKTGDIK